MLETYPGFLALSFAYTRAALAARQTKTKREHLACSISSSTKGCLLALGNAHPRNHETQNAKREPTAPWIPTWSPTVVGRGGHIEGLKDSVHNVQSPSHRSSPSMCPSLPTDGACSGLPPRGGGDQHAGEKTACRKMLRRWHKTRGQTCSRCPPLPAAPSGTP